ncbi:isoaspartyl peptidase/L-asparaginase [Novosphingobium resinovorum]|uniref:isoaspartyl peptidase/L-asparaginase n=1 Tax=Novosphingobium resinovorum TaxID=158500 RepID=UPI002ED53D00|nr:isoaspartyl peptidase/L-asparaginase [Novosphingobium resinovorum]
MKFSSPRKLASALFLGTGAGALFAAAPALAAPGYKHYVLGDVDASAATTHEGGLLLMGGGDRNNDAMKWFFGHAGGGHIVILRASLGGQIGEEFYKQIGGIRSAETFVFTDRKAAYDPKIIAALRRADGIFIAGGDQSRYVRYWRGTPVAEALDAHVAAGKPLGGTSAGLAMLGEKLYGAMDGGSITSAEALPDPHGSANTIESDFLHLAALKGVITDTHFKERDRLGRLFAFLAKAQVGRAPDDPALLGLGVDESAAIAVEADGSGRIYATAPDGGAWLVNGDGLRGTATSGPLQAHRVRVTGIGAGSVVHLPSGKVDAPTFVRNYAVTGGSLVQVPLWSLAIHGGAGVIERGDLTPGKEKAYRAGLDAALRAGAAVLDKGGASLDAVEAAVRVLEDDPMFNAGRGAVFTAEGRNELDSAIMDGATLKAGAVAGVTRTRHPVDAARAVMDHSPHVMLMGAGADAFSKDQGLEQVDPSWFRTEARWQQFLTWKKTRQAALDRTHLFGTVGAVALDADGNLAAATSTGGMTGKRWGRVGDSPIIGAGTYAKNGQCAVSATGSGEYFIRESAARQVCDRVGYLKQPLAEAAQATIMAVGAIGGDGGLIAMGPDGTPAFAINDLGMYRGRIAEGGTAATAIYADERPGD